MTSMTHATLVALDLTTIASIVMAESSVPGGEGHQMAIIR